jgi:hypothetical protein
MALAGAVQAIVPSAATALLTTCGEPVCDADPQGGGPGSSEDGIDTGQDGTKTTDPNAVEGAPTSPQQGSDNGLGPGNVTSDGNNTTSYGPIHWWEPAQEKERTEDWVKNGGSPYPNWIADDDAWAHAVQARVRYERCESLQRNIKLTIRGIGEDLEDDDFDFAWIRNPSNGRLRRQETNFVERNCADVLDVSYGRSVK